MTHGRDDDAHTDQIHHAGGEQPGTGEDAGSGTGPDPVRLARLHLFQSVRRAASGGGPDSETDDTARTVAAADRLSAHAGDRGTREEACLQVDLQLHMLANTPALTVADVVPKVAALVLDLARSGSGGELKAGTTGFILAACILADLTILRNGPIGLPPHAFDPIDSPEIIAHWRRMAEAGR